MKKLLTIVAAGTLLVATQSCQAKDNPQKKDTTMTQEAGPTIKRTMLQEKPDAAKAKKGDLVTVHYTGWLDAEKTKKFDSSVDRGTPFQFKLGVGMVIPGWDLGLDGVGVGEKIMLEIPAKLAYGPRSVGSIPANSKLFFEVELLSVS